MGAWGRGVPGSACHRKRDSLPASVAACREGAVGSAIADLERAGADGRCASVGVDAAERLSAGSGFDEISLAGDGLAWIETKSHTGI